MDLAAGNDMANRLKEDTANKGAAMVLVLAQVEAELVDFDAEDHLECLKSLGMGIDCCGLWRVIGKDHVYDILNFQTYLTSGPTETPLTYVDNCTVIGTA